MHNCIIDNNTTNTVIDLGNQYVSNFVSEKDILTGDISPLQLCICEKCGLLQLNDIYPQEKMYKQYWYRSCINEAMRKALRDIVISSYKYVNVQSGDVVIDIASNDGTLLTNWGNNIVRVGIDPSDVAEKSEIYKNNNIFLINDFFSEKTYKEKFNKKAKVITAIAMLYDIYNPIDFVNQVSNCLEDDGVLIIQCSYMPLMLIQNAFDNICHEHLAYYSLLSIQEVFSHTDISIVDIELNDVNGGSFRIYSTKRSNNNTYIPKYIYDIGKYKINSIEEYEKTLKLKTAQPYVDFMNRIDNLKTQTINWLMKQKEQNKLVIGYGASTKGNTLLQYYGITNELLPYIAERSEEKYGLYTVGTGIPIISEAEMRKMKPDYLFALPWQFINSFINREKELMQQGTKFIVPLPELHLYE